MTRHARTALLLAFGIALAAAPAGAQSPSPSPTAVPTVYRANVLAIEPGRLTLTGGETVRVAPDCACAVLPAGAAAVVTIDLQRNAVVALRPATAADASLPSAALIPRALLAMDPRSVRPDREAAEKTVALVEVRITVTVPPQTPPGDDVYLSTDRTTFNPNELRMNRVDAVHWTIALALPDGSSLHYQFTRGSYQTVERDLSNGVIPARLLVARAGEIALAQVQHWNDQP